MPSDTSSTRPSLRPFLLAGLTAAAGLALSLYAGHRMARTEAVKARLAAETLRQNTEQELARFTEVLESVCALHALSDAVDQPAMDEFIEKGLVHQHTVLGPFGLAQRIGPQLRRAMESEARAGQGTGYIVQQQAPDGSWVPAEARPIYYPLTWQTRANALGVPTGFDFATVPRGLETIRKIEQTRTTALAPSPIPAPDGTAPAYWVFAPVIPGQFQSSPFPTPGAVIGFAAAQLRPEQLLQRVSSLSSLSPELRLVLIESPDAERAGTVRRENGRWLYSQPLEAVGAQWQFECALPTRLTGRRPETAVALGLLITALLSSQLLILGNRTRKIETEVRTRTRELHRAKQQIEETLQERALLEEKIHELAAQERRRIGSDLHDSLGQKLTGAVFLSRSLLNHFSDSRDERRTHAKTLNETLKDAVTQVRDMARGLAPVSLSDESLGETFQQLAEEMSKLYEIPCEVTECDLIKDLSSKTREQLYLIAREAVNNAARHAAANRISIRLTGDSSRWILRIEDDGKGLPSDRSAGDGMGIRIMKHRAGLIGAELSIHSAPGQGTAVEISS